MKKIIYLAIFCAFWAIPHKVIGQNIIVNEILTSNSTSIQDEDSSHEDWIEIYNKGSVSVNLSGYGLSDDGLSLYKWTFPSVSLASHQYMIVWASDKNRRVVGSPLHTNFKISSSGENIYLTNPSGSFTDTVPPAALQPNISYGRSPNGTGAFVYFGTPTPNASNSTTAYSGNLDPPVFSQNAGFYPSSISLTLSAPEPGSTILYTLDGSEPDENNLSGTTYTYRNVYVETPGQTAGPLLNNSYRTKQYTSPLTINDRSAQPNDLAAMSSTFHYDPTTYMPSSPIFKSTTVRAKVIKPGYLPSMIITKNYFITPLGSGKYTFPIVSINLNEDRFFGYNSGIFVAGKDFDLWRAANPNGDAKASGRGNYYLDSNNERVGNLSYFVNGAEVINQDVGLTIRGGVTRRFQNKSLTIFARSDYGDDDMDYKFFTKLPYTSYERMTLSISGGDFKHTLFRDAFLHDVCKELYPEKEAYQPTITFVNGEYWGIMNLRERFDNNYFKRVYNTSATDFLENEGVVKEGDNNHYLAMVNYLNSNSMAVQANYNYIKTQLDPENVADYFISNIFFLNEDWPNNNVFYWRNKIAAYNPAAPYGLDGRWRYMFHDMDNSMGFVFGDYNSNSLATATSVNTPPNYLNPDWSTVVLRKLLVNPSFKNDFINRFADLLNTSFLTSRTLQRLNEMAAAVGVEIPEQVSRWKAPASTSNYNSFIAREQDFLTVRPAYQRDHIRSVFSISSNINATLNVSNAAHGYIKMNTINILDGTPGITGNPYPWTGIYFKNIPIKLKAIAKPGYIFTNWSGASTSTNEEITITPTGNFSITANFIIDTTTETSVPTYFWMMNGTLVNGAQLTSMNSTYELGADGVIQYQSCLAGYPFAVGNPSYSKASMERRNNPTTLNYRQSINGNLPYASSDMRGLQIKQPFQSGGLENTMIFNFSTAGYKKIMFSFAAVDEGAASGISVEYSVNSGAAIWLTTGLSSSSLTLTSAYQLFAVDFTSITTVNNNPNFKIRLRFTGSNMTSDLGNRVTFNNIAVDGVKLPLYYTSPNVFTVGAPIANLTPTTSETITSYSVSPALPSGVILNAGSGIISGTPTAVSAAATYTVSAIYATGTLTYGVSIGVNNAAPTNLSYTSPNTFSVNTAIGSLSPSVSGGAVLSYSVLPSLPSGLVLNVLSGVISGTPTAAAGTASYVVTASNSGGSASFSIVITVNEAAPNSLGYPSPNIFTKNTAIGNLNPSVSGGAVDSYNITPALPTGLIFDTITGRISGTPTAVRSMATYTVTATNSSGSDSFGVVITINDIAPSGLSYTSPNVYTKNTPITNLNPSVSGGAVVSYSISPALSSGLSFNTATGRISGTPSAIRSLTTYTVTATNSGGSDTFNLDITVNDIAPSGLSYTSPNVYTKNTPITNLNPSVSGGAVVSYTISPALSGGLSFNTATGRISGTPSAIRGLTTYTVIATNSGGSDTFNLDITVNDIAPNGLSYTSPNVFTIGNLISSLFPSGTGAVISYNVSPPLPAGLTLNTSTGEISGTPTTISPLETYTITATNSGGSATVYIDITVNDIAPSGLSYTSPNFFTKGNPISSLYPSDTAAVISYNVIPPLPAGLTLNTSTGEISGTPTTISSMATYNITATNSGGTSSFGIVITVNDIAPNGLSYPSPNIFTKNTAITNLDPIIYGGTIVSYSITPALPSGLLFNTSTGRISGIPTIVSSMTTYTVTANNSGGASLFGIDIAVNDTAPDELSYPSPNVFSIGSPINSLFPSIAGTIIEYNIWPALPSGLSFNTETGEISGTPDQISGTENYTVTAINSGGSDEFDIIITINDIAPSSLSYASPNVFTRNSAIPDLNPSVAGGTVVIYSVTPNLPSGLLLDTASGIISGTPNVISQMATYIITAFNSGGSTSFDLMIAVNDIAPDALSYPSPNIFTRGSSISILFPSVSGNIIGYNINTPLPDGLSFNTITGEIAGTPTVISPMAIYRVTAFNSGGSTSFNLMIAVNDIAPDALSYPSPNIFTRGSSISTLFPSVSGNIIGYSINTSLPDGLSFNTITGEIAGTPNVISPMATYRITAFNLGGSTSFNLMIAVNDIAPDALSYPSPNIFTRGNSISSLFPSISGNIIGYNINAALPAGLSLNTATGEIEGTPNVISPMATYRITAINSGGSTSFNLMIAVNDIAPEALSYSSPNVFTKNAPISNLMPMASGGAVVNYSIAPSLPDGLIFNTATGEISGTPTAISAATTYLVTAINTGGFSTFDVLITVNDIAPSALSYSIQNVFTTGNEIAILWPAVTGNVAAYSVFPALPSGLFLNTTTGEISGTPIGIFASALFTITAVNSGGSITFDLQITVNDLAPSALSYPSPNTFIIGTPITSLWPTITGNIIGYSVDPILPSGLSINAQTGEISGTPSGLIASGSYTITAFNSGGSVSFDIEITVDEALGNEQSSFDKITVYPNPFDTMIFIEGSSNAIFYRLYSIDGKLIRVDQLRNPQIDLEELAGGVYLLELTSKNKVKKLKIIKR